MVARKSRSFNVQSAYNLHPKFAHRVLMILSLLENGITTQKEIQQRTQLTRKEVGYALARMMDQGLCYDPHPKSNKWKAYKISVAGRSFVGEVRSNDTTANKVMNENVRMKCVIQTTDKIPKILENQDYSFRENINWKNSKQYHGKIENHTVVINVGKSASLIVIAPRYHGSFGSQVGYLAIRGILDVCANLKSKYQVELGMAEFYEGEYVVHTPYSEAVMNKTRGKQVTTTRYKVNQSSPFFIPHEEFANPLDLDKHLEIPKRIESLSEELSQMVGNVGEINYKISSLDQSLVKMVDVFSETVKNQQNNQSIIQDMVSQFAKITTSLTELANAVNETKSRVESTIGDKSVYQQAQPMNSDTTRMFT